MQIFAQTFIKYLIIIMPWLIIGVIISYILSKYVNHKVFKKFSGKISYKKLAASQVLGMVSPLSIMSFLPVASELTSWGVNPGFLLSFFIAERAYDIQSFFIISGLFHIKMAIINFSIIFLSLFIAAIAIHKDQVKFTKRKLNKEENFWARQGKLLAIITLGIILGAIIKTIVPSNLVSYYAGGTLSGIAAAVFLGFTTYLGPVAGNYPVAKALSELGMSSAGTLAFLSISPIFNFIIIVLFSASVGFKKAIKPIMIYTFTALVLTLLFAVVVK